MSLIYAPEPDALKARDRAFTHAEVKLALTGGSSRLKWMLTAPDVGYSPYVVKIYSLSGLDDTNARMSFIDCHTAEELGQPVTVDLTDRALVWPHLPSTLDGWNQDTADCAFVFFSAKIHSLTQIAGGEGKWPRGASLVAAHEQVCSLVREHLLSDDLASAANRHDTANAVSLFHNLDPDHRERLKRLVGGLR